jgi:hypothetical protein
MSECVMTAYEPRFSPACWHAASKSPKQSTTFCRASPRSAQCRTTQRAMRCRSHAALVGCGLGGGRKQRRNRPPAPHPFQVLCCALPNSLPQACLPVSRTTRSLTPCRSDQKLQDYQMVGLNWLVLLHRHDVNGILADEMGCTDVFLCCCPLFGFLSVSPGLFVLTPCAGSAKQCKQSPFLGIFLPRVIRGRISSLCHAPPSARVVIVLSALLELSVRMVSARLISHNRQLGARAEPLLPIARGHAIPRCG